MDALRMVGVLRAVGVGGLLVWLLATLMTVISTDFMTGEAKLSAVAGAVGLTALGILVVLLAAKALERLERP